MNKEKFNKIVISTIIIALVISTCFSINLTENHRINVREYSSVTHIMKYECFESRSISYSQGKDFIDFCFNNISDPKVLIEYDDDIKEFSHLDIRRYHHYELDDFSKTRTNYSSFDLSLLEFSYENTCLYPDSFKTYCNLKKYFYKKYLENKDKIKEKCIPPRFDKNFINYSESSE